MKKNKNKVKNNSNFSQIAFLEFDEVKRLAIIVFIVVAAFAIIYYSTTLIISNKKATSEQLDVNIQYQNILMSSILEQDSDEYYVLITEKDDKYINVYQTYLNMNNDKFYVVDLNDAFNRSYKSDTSNLAINNIDDLKVSQTTLIKISNQHITEFYEGKDQIIEKLKK